MKPSCFSKGIAIPVDALIEISSHLRPWVAARLMGFGQVSAVNATPQGKLTQRQLLG
jgi:hypothetical protein